MENLKSSESGALLPTQDIGKSSDTLVNTSSISKTRRQLMSIKERIMKDKRLLFGRDTMDGIRDGELSMPIKPKRLRVRDIATNSDSTS
jgi:hypothetical protein